MPVQDEHQGLTRYSGKAFRSNQKETLCTSFCRNVIQSEMVETTVTFLPGFVQGLLRNDQDDRG